MRVAGATIAVVAAVVAISVFAFPCGCGAGAADGASRDAPPSPGRLRSLPASAVTHARGDLVIDLASAEADPILARVKALAARRASADAREPDHRAPEDGPKAAPAATPRARDGTPAAAAAPPSGPADLLPRLKGATPRRPAGPPAAEEFVLGPGDEVDVVVSGQPEFSGVVTVRADGTIALATTGDVVRAGGATEAALAEAIAAAVSPRYVKSRPAVSAVVVRSPRLAYYVFGAVRRAGRCEMPPGGVTVMDAVIRASGEPGDRAGTGAVRFEPVTGARYEAVRVVAPAEAGSAVRTVDVSRAMLGGPEALERVRAGEIVIVPSTGGQWSEAALEEKLRGAAGVGAAERGAP